MLKRNDAYILHRRLFNQHITATPFTKPAEIVRHLGAMQSQDYGMAKWAIGLRLPHLREADVDEAFNKGHILRTHILRPTWHFVSPEDIRWMMELTAPRVNAFNAYYYRLMELDKKVFKKCHAILKKALGGNNHLTRTALKAILEKSKIKAEGQRLGAIMMEAELACVVCSGPKQGKQFTYALVDERAPNAISMKRDEALARLTGIYFSTRGPATVHDYSWWSGLTVREASEGIAMLGKEFMREEMNGATYIFKDGDYKKPTPAAATFLMPDYDEYGISYKDRKELFADQPPKNSRLLKDWVFFHTIIQDGKSVGTWKKVQSGQKTMVETSLYNPVSQAKQQLIDKAVKRYTDFFNS